MRDTEAEAMQAGARFLSAVEMVRGGNVEPVVDVLYPFDDDAPEEVALRGIFGMFAVAALLTGRMLRKATLPADDPSPMDGHVAMAIEDVQTGLPAHPDDLDPQMKVTLWAVVAGANGDMETATAHMRTLMDGGGIDALTGGVITMLKMAATMWDGGAAPMRRPALRAAMEDLAARVRAEAARQSYSIDNGALWRIALDIEELIAEHEPRDTWHALGWTLHICGVYGACVDPIAPPSVHLFNHQDGDARSRWSLWLPSLTHARWWPRLDRYPPRETSRTASGATVVTFPSSTTET